MTFGIRAADDHLTDEQGRLFAHIFRRELSGIRRITFVNIQSSARRLIAAEAIQTCQTCAVDKADVGATEPILRSWRQAWRITCPVCRSRLHAIGQGSAAHGEDDPPSLASWEEVLEGERLLEDYAERGIETWAPQLTCSGSC
jgi:hypothetical protein